MFIEEILNFFFQNIFFLVILLFGLSQFFRRKASNASEDRGNDPKKSPLPPVVKPFFEEWLDPQKHETKKEVFEETRDFEEYTDEIDHVTTFEREDVETYSPPLPTPQSVRVEPRERTIHVQDDEIKIEPNVFRNPTRREVAQGIIWAEILGPPRAKRKYTYRR